MSQPTEVLTPAQVCELLGVSNAALKYWRDPNRLKRGVDDPLYLPPKHLAHSHITYPVADVVAFCERNPRYADKLVADHFTDPAGEPA